MASPAQWVESTGRVNRSVAAGYSEHPRAATAVGEVIGEVLGRIDPHPDLAVLLVSGRHTAELESIVNAVRILVAPQVLIGSDVPMVFDGTEERAGADGLLLWAAHIGESAPKPFRFDPGDPAAGWHGPDGAPPAAGAVTLVLGQPDAPVRDIPGPVIGIGGSTGDGLVLLGSRVSGGAVAVQLDSAVISPFDFVLPLWEDLPDDSVTDPEPGGDPGPWPLADGYEPNLEHHGQVFDPGPGAGILLFAGRQNRAPMGARFDFEMVINRFSGAVGGALAPVVWSPAPPDRQDTAARAICGLVVR